MEDLSGLYQELCNVDVCGVKYSLSTDKIDEYFPHMKIWIKDGRIAIDDTLDAEELFAGDRDWIEKFIVCLFSADTELAFEQLPDDPRIALFYCLSAYKFIDKYLLAARDETFVIQVKEAVTKKIKNNILIVGLQLCAAEQIEVDDSTMILATTYIYDRAKEVDDECLVYAEDVPLIDFIAYKDLFRQLGGEPVWPIFGYESGHYLSEVGISETVLNLICL